MATESPNLPIPTITVVGANWTPSAERKPAAPAEVIQWVPVKPGEFTYTVTSPTGTITEVVVKATVLAA